MFHKHGHKQTRNKSFSAQLASPNSPSSIIHNNNNKTSCLVVVSLITYPWLVICHSWVQDKPWSSKNSAANRDAPPRTRSVSFFRGSGTPPASLNHLTEFLTSRISSLPRCPLFSPFTTSLTASKPAAKYFRPASAGAPLVMETPARTG